MANQYLHTALEETNRLCQMILGEGEYIPDPIDPDTSFHVLTMIFSDLLQNEMLTTVGHTMAGGRALRNLTTAFRGYVTSTRDRNPVVLSQLGIAETVSDPTQKLRALFLTVREL